MSRETDWAALEQRVRGCLDEANAALGEFGSAHGYVARASFWNFPPLLSVTIYKPEAERSRRKTVGFNIGSGNNCNVIQVYEPNETELDEIAAFVGELGSKLNLRPYRDRDAGLAPLRYELRYKR